MVRAIELALVRLSMNHKSHSVVLETDLAIAFVIEGKRYIWALVSLREKDKTMTKILITTTITTITDVHNTPEMN